MEPKLLLQLALAELKLALSHRFGLLLKPKLVYTARRLRISSAGQAHDVRLAWPWLGLKLGVEPKHCLEVALKLKFGPIELWHRFGVLLRPKLAALKLCPEVALGLKLRPIGLRHWF